MSTRVLVIVTLSVLIVSGLVGAASIWQGTTNADTGAEGEALIGGPFSLVDHTGSRVTEKDFEGRFMIAYFGYTFCPDFCPMGLSTITDALDMLDEEQAERVTPVFFSVDPKRDTVEQLAEYVTHFHPSMRGLTGTEGEVDAAAKAFRVYYRVPDDGGDAYAVDHSAFTYLMAPDGSYRTHFSHNVTPEEIAERLRTELQKG